MSGHSYTWLAQYYAQYMEHVDYVKWSKSIRSWWKKHGHQPSHLLEIAAGELSLARELNLQCPSVHSDLSWSMLSQAPGFPRAAADMRQLPFGDESFDSLICLYDSINYMLDEEDLEEALSEMSRVLQPGGMLLFDAVSPWTCAKYFADFRDWMELEEGFLLRHAQLDEEMELQSNTFTLVDRQGQTRTEKHLQKLRHLDEWYEILSQRDDLEFLGAYANFGQSLAKESSERWHFVLQKRLS